MIYFVIWWVTGFLGFYGLIRWVQGSEWTIGDRVACLMWSCFGFVVLPVFLACVAMSAISDHTESWWKKHKDKPATW